MLALLILVSHVGASPLDQTAVRDRAERWLAALALSGLPPRGEDRTIKSDLAVRTRGVIGSHLPGLKLLALDFGDGAVAMDDVVVFGQLNLPAQVAELRHLLRHFDRTAAALKPRVPAVYGLVSGAAADTLAALVRGADGRASPFRPALYFAQVSELVTTLIATPTLAEGTRGLLLDTAIGLRRRIAVAFPNGPGGDHSLERERLNRNWLKLSAAIEVELLAACGRTLVY